MLGSKNMSKSNKTGNYDKVKAKCNSSEWNADGVLIRIFILITCIKILLIPTYHSTDFEVHRNWLAITHSLPIKEWYINAKSEWTLDYPPLFAWFEYFLSQIGSFVDNNMLQVDNLSYVSHTTVLFQRGTVIFADLLFLYGVREIGKTFCKSYDTNLIFTFLSLCNIGLIIVDHIHFQYNGFLLGILLLSIAKTCQIFDQMCVLQGAVWFAVLLNLKHIYLYVAPVYIIWLFKWYCLKSGQFFRNICILGCAGLSIFALSFGPFVIQLPQVLSRLFPFKRGLVHAYWAPNGWSLYIAVDKALSVLCKSIGVLKQTKIASMTGGLVQEESFAVLPTPTPLVTFLLTFATMIPALWFLFKKSESTADPNSFIRCLVLCGLSSFMFGWHVHEKAILTAIIPLCVLVTTNIQDARMFIILSSAGHTALLPLLYPQNLMPLKLMLLVLYMTLTYMALSHYFKKPLLTAYEWVYVSSLPFITIYETVLHRLIFRDKLPFLPLAITSIYCAIGVTYAWLFYHYTFLRDNNDVFSKKEEKEQPIIQKSKKQTTA